MPIEKLETLQKMQPGQSGKVVEVHGGHILVSRLSAMGIRPGKRITKVSSMLMRGPVTVQVGHTRLALGFGMSNKIMVSLEGLKDDVS